MVYIASMELDEARDLLSRTDAERREAVEQIKTAQATVDSCRLIMQGILRRFPQLNSDSLGADDGDWVLEDSRPTGAAAVYKVLLDNDKQGYSVARMVNELQNRNWLPNSANPANAVRTALERVRADPKWGVLKDVNPEGTVIYYFDSDVWVAQGRRK